MATVVWVIDSLRLGGAERLALAWQAEGPAGEWRHRLAVLQCAGDAASFEAEAQARGVEWWCAGARHLRDLAAWRRLRDYLRREQADLLHAHLGYATLWAAGAARALRIPWLATVHILPGQARGWRARALERLQITVLNRSACRIVLLSQAQRRAWTEAGLHRRQRAVLLPNGVAASPLPLPAERAAARHRLGIAPSARLFLTVAAVRPDKGWRDWLGAIPLIAARVPEAQFVWIGDGAEATLLRAQAAARADTRHIGLGADIGAWLKCADIFLFPSHVEAQPTALIEAMAAGLPIVAYDLEVHRELLGTDAGWRVERGKSAALAGAAAAAALDPESARSRGRRAYERYSAQYAQGLWRQRLAELYQTVLDEQASRRLPHEHAAAA